MYYSYFDKEKNRLKNYYKLLNISRDSVESVIHQRYQSLYESGKITESIQEAYEILSHPDQRDRYNRVYDRYNWDYGLQKNALYEKSKPKNRGRVLFLFLILGILGFSTIAFFLLREPETDIPVTSAQDASTSQPDISTAPQKKEADPVIEPEEEPSQENSQAPDTKIQEASAPLDLFVSEEILTAYPNFTEVTANDDLYPKAQVTAGVNFRNAPSMDSEILSALGTDESFTVLGKVGGWSYIHRADQGYGWIGGKYIRYTE